MGAPYYGGMSWRSIMLAERKRARRRMVITAAAALALGGLVVGAWPWW
jgi:hypothetical protein